MKDKLLLGFVAGVAATALLKSLAGGRKFASENGGEMADRIEELRSRYHGMMDEVAARLKRIKAIAAEKNEELPIDDRFTV